MNLWTYIYEDEWNQFAESHLSHRANLSTVQENVTHAKSLTNLLL